MVDDLKNILTKICSAYMFLNKKFLHIKFEKRKSRIIKRIKNRKILNLIPNLCLSDHEKYQMSDD